ncbi:MAG TPA: hypothetical protein VMI31_15925 [Fimbriimonadaceae bacterium]|nr:hypothetical protein [Fimbriimonadaceae bacterium]
MPVRFALALSTPTTTSLGLMFLAFNFADLSWQARSLLISGGLAVIVSSLRWSIRMMAKAGAAIRPKLEERFGQSFEGFTHVGISPHKKPGIYAGDSSWDIGFVSIGENLSYFGDQCWFTLSRDQILSHRLSCATVASPRLLIEYTWPSWEGTRWMNIEARDALGRTDQFLVLQRLANQIAIMPGRVPASEGRGRRNPLLNLLVKRA